MKALSKHCEVCGQEFLKRPRESAEQWGVRRFCSKNCANKSHNFTPIHIRFWKFVNKDSNGCWFWTGATDGRGYGHISTARDKSPQKAYRLAYEMRYGPIPEGGVICHKCDTPLCVNPEHLFLGTQKDNMQDASKKGRLNPASLLNLRPGAPGYLGAGPVSNGDRKNG